MRGAWGHGVWDLHVQGVRKRTVFSQLLHYVLRCLFLQLFPQRLGFGTPFLLPLSDGVAMLNFLNFGHSDTKLQLLFSGK